jgi:hypothetical protein
MALGPLLLGWLADLYGLRQGIMFVSPVLLVSAVLTWLATRFYDDDHEYALIESVRQHLLEQSDPRKADAADPAADDDTVPAHA